MKQIRALRANGIVMLVSSVITAVCVGSTFRLRGSAEYLVEKTSKGEIENEND